MDRSAAADIDTITLHRIIAVTPRFAPE